MEAGKTEETAEAPAPKRGTGGSYIIDDHTDDAAAPAGSVAAEGSASAEETPAQPKKTTKAKGE